MGNIVTWQEFSRFSVLKPIENARRKGKTNNVLKYKRRWRLKAKVEHTFRHSNKRFKVLYSAVRAKLIFEWTIV